MIPANRVNLFTSDRAENSVMQTITIAVSTIIIAAGMVTVPNIVNNGRDDRVKADLVSIGLAEDFQASNTGTYIGDTSILQSNGGTQINLSSATWTKITLTSSTGYGILGISESGKVFIINASIEKPVFIGEVKFDGEGANKSVRANSFELRPDANSVGTTAKMTESGFTTADIYTATKNP